MHIFISNTSKLPIYEQIYQQIQTLILNGELVEGTPLPSIRQLAKDLQVSVITSKRAYEELEKDGFIVSLVGKGSFVAPQNKELLKEQRLKTLEKKLSEVIIESKLIGLSKQDFFEWMSLLYGDDEDDERG